MRLFATLTATLALLAASPASADSTLSRTEARNAAYIFGHDVLAPSLIAPGQHATLTISACRTRGRRGICNARISGAIHCKFRAHVVEERDDFAAWADRLHC